MCLIALCSCFNCCCCCCCIKNARVHNINTSTEENLPDHDAPPSYLHCSDQIERPNTGLPSYNSFILVKETNEMDQTENIQP